VRRNIQAASSIGTVPLVPRLRLLGSSFGGYTSIRRGQGTDVAGSRPYQPGDHFHTIDWKGSARLSSARARDEFIVRDRQAEEMPRVVIVCDRRPEMELFPPELPWLQKPVATAWSIRLLAASAVNQRALIGYLDHASHDGGTAGQPFWRSPRSQASGWHGDLVETLVGYGEGVHDAPTDTVAEALRFLGLLRSSVTPGSFVFVLSDFLVEIPPDAWGALAGRGWDVIPVVVQDPIWEHSFPPIGGLATTFSDVGGERVLPIRLSASEADDLRERHEARRERLLASFVEVGLDHVDVSSADPGDIHAAFLAWAEARLLHGGRL
jgi:Protein of unknown function DUF58